MPYKTQYGSHYHETYGCHGATIPCDAKGLTPCSDCCGGQESGDGSLGGATPAESAGAVPSHGTSEFNAPDGSAPPMSEGAVMVQQALHPGTAYLGGVSRAMREASTDTRQAVIDETVAAFAKAMMQGMAKADSRGTDAQPRMSEESATAQPTPHPNTTRPRNGRNAPQDVSADTRQEVVDETVAAFARAMAEGASQPTPASEDDRRPIGTEVARPQPSPHPHAPRARQDASHDLRRAIIDETTTAYAKAMLSTPALAKQTLTRSSEILRHADPTPRKLPVFQKIGRLGKRIRNVIGGMALAASNRHHQRQERRALNAIKRRERCNDWTARCLLALEEEERLGRTKQAAADSIRYRQSWNSAGGKAQSYDDIVADSIVDIGLRIRRQWGISNEDELSVDQFMGYVNSISRAINEGGYGDKISPESIASAKRRLGARGDYPVALTEAMETARNRHMFVTRTAPATVATFRRQQAAMTSA